MQIHKRGTSKMMHGIHDRTWIVVIPNKICAYFTSGAVDNGSIDSKEPDSNNLQTT